MVSNEVKAKNDPESNNFGLPTTDSQLLQDLDHHVSTCREHAKILNRFLQDNELSMEEAHEVHDHLEAIQKSLLYLSAFQDKLKEMADFLNQVISTGEGILTPVEYVIDVRKRGEHNVSVDKATAYYLEDESMDQFHQFITETMETREFILEEVSCIEDALVATFKTFLNIYNRYLPGVLMAQVPSDVKEFLHNLQRLVISCRPLFSLLRQDFYISEIDAAIDGANKLINSRELEEKGRIKLKRLFLSKKGYTELKNLVEIFVNDEE